jgi:two-component system, OmpR family, KDP operon response regulator KdpE
MPEPRDRKAVEPLVLIVEDEPQIVRFLRATLPPHGYHVIDAPTAADGLREAASRTPDVVLLDLGLPDLDGVEVVRRIREWSAMPIVVLSARGQEKDKVEALDAGADDYLTKPFGTDELLARMRVAIRRSARSEDSKPVVEAGSLRIDLAARVVHRGGEEVRLTRTEYRLVAALAQHPGKVLTHRQLLREVWGPNAELDTPYLRVYMAQLRHKLEDDPARPRCLLTETGVGYRLKVEP